MSTNAALLMPIGVQYEVAIEKIGQSLKPYIHGKNQELKKENPSAAMIDFYDSRISSLDELQEELRPTDVMAIKGILDGTTPL